AAPAASRSGQDLHRASIGLRSLVSIIGLRSLVSIDSIIAASSPLPRRRLSPALASMAARAGVGNRHRGAGSESGPATTTMGTTKRHEALDRNSDTRIEGDADGKQRCGRVPPPGKTVPSYRAHGVNGRRENQSGGDGGSSRPLRSRFECWPNCEGLE